jgi:hypothetical protein
MRELLESIECLYFDGDSRRGPRHAFILRELTRRGCVVHTDHHRNMWVEKGSGRPIVLYSSHMDVDPKVGKKNFLRHKPHGRGMAGGILDNAVGCVINILLAEEGPKRGTGIYVFTASEEVDRKNDRCFARSAREIVRELRKRKVKPDLCVAVDVTYPKLLHHHQNMDWSRKHHELFHANDDTHCYLDGYVNRRSMKIGEALVRRFRSLHVKMREFPGYDEAMVYSRIAPSFAFGPVVYGSFDAPKQTMPLAHMKTALEFLKRIRL